VLAIAFSAWAVDGILPEAPVNQPHCRDVVFEVPSQAMEVITLSDCIFCNAAGQDPNIISLNAADEACYVNTVRSEYYIMPETRLKITLNKVVLDDHSGNSYAVMPAISNNLSNLYNKSMFREGKLVIATHSWLLGLTNGMNYNTPEVVLKFGKQYQERVRFI